MGLRLVPAEPSAHVQREAIARRTGRTVEQALEHIRQTSAMDESSDGAVEDMASYGIDHSVIEGTALPRPREPARRDVIGDRYPQPVAGSGGGRRRCATESRSAL